MLVSVGIGAQSETLTSMTVVASQITAVGHVKDKSADYARFVLAKGFSFRTGYGSDHVVSVSAVGHSSEWFGVFEDEQFLESKRNCNE
ncbi:hypothetical protein GCM10022278_31980 [Allohahella marinimesophila]|uniref:Uncharacterized protein n=1 Tax=Allohahella marinimesophila TaxID=1054972 RepID=A0ABP7PWM6_9GAMM